MPKSKWSQVEDNFQPELCDQLVKGLWDKIFRPPTPSNDIILKRLQPLAGFLRDDLKRHNPNADISKFDLDLKKAIEEKDLTLFKSIFQNLSSDSLLMIINGEEIKLPVTEKYPSITDTDIINLNEYMVERRISAAVSVSNHEAIFSTESNNLTSNTPISIHSIGKVITGILLLKMIRNGIISEDDLNKPIQLDNSVLEQLPTDVRDRLKHVTLRQIMTHYAGLGGYLEKQFASIDAAKEQGYPVPIVNQSQELLKYADDNVSSIGVYQYSNLGILLVGMAMEYYYNQYQEKKTVLSNTKPAYVSIDALMNEFAINDVKMACFTCKPPYNARLDQNDPYLPYIYGCPAGGYWTTTSDLQKFALWIQRECGSDKEFERLVKEYGDEFYDKNNNVIAHGGDIATGSAWFYCSLENDTSICILSDQGGRTAKHLFNELLMQTAWFAPILVSRETPRIQDRSDSLEQNINRPPSPSHAYHLFRQQSPNAVKQTNTIDGTVADNREDLKRPKK